MVGSRRGWIGVAAILAACGLVVIGSLWLLSVERLGLYRALRQTAGSAHVVEIWGDVFWEISEKSYYQILRDGQVVAPICYVESFGSPEQVAVYQAGDLVFGVDGERSTIVLFIHRMSDDLSYPGTEVSDDSARGDQLLRELRMATGKITWELADRTNNYDAH